MKERVPPGAGEAAAIVRGRRCARKGREMSEEMPLAGMKVLDIATLFAGPVAAMLLGDYGADVLKIEHPNGDAVRHHGANKNGVPLWWKMMGRNKRAITLYLGHPEGQALFKRLVRDADI